MKCLLFCNNEVFPVMVGIPDLKKRGKSKFALYLECVMTSLPSLCLIDPDSFL